MFNQSINQAVKINKRDIQTHRYMFNQSINQAVKINNLHSSTPLHVQSINKSNSQQSRNATFKHTITHSINQPINEEIK